MGELEPEINTSLFQDEEVFSPFPFGKNSISMLKNDLLAEPCYLFKLLLTQPLEYL